MLGLLLEAGARGIARKKNQAERNIDGAATQLRYAVPHGIGLYEFVRETPVGVFW